MVSSALVCLFVSLFVSRITQKLLLNRFSQNSSVVVKIFFRSRDLGHQVSRPRPRPGQNELECTRVSRPWSRDHNTAASILDIGDRALA